MNSKVYKIMKKEKLKAARVSKIIRENNKYRRFLDNITDIEGAYDEDEQCLSNNDIDEIDALGLEYNGGATRYVVIDTDEKEKYIIKDNYKTKKIWDDEKQQYNYEEYEFDYCEDEIKLRERIIKRYPALAELFLPLYSIEDGYAQEKCKTYASTYIEEDEEYKNRRNLIKQDKVFMKYIDENVTESQYYDSDDNYDEVNAIVRVLGWNYQWYYAVFKFYGIKILKQLLEAIDEFGIDDLRDENIGYTMNDRPVLIDYVGYHEEW